MCCRSVSLILRRSMAGRCRPLKDPPWSHPMKLQPFCPAELGLGCSGRCRIAWPGGFGCLARWRGIARGGGGLDAQSMLPDSATAPECPLPPSAKTGAKGALTAAAVISLTPWLVDFTMPGESARRSKDTRSWGGRRSAEITDIDTGAGRGYRQPLVTEATLRPIPRCRRQPRRCGGR